MSMTDLAGHMGVTVATMSLAIDRLERQGLRAARPRPARWPPRAAAHHPTRACACARPSRCSIRCASSRCSRSSVRRRPRRGAQGAAVARSRIRRAHAKSRRRGVEVDSSFAVRAFEADRSEAVMRWMLDRRRRAGAPASRSSPRSARRCPASTPPAGRCACAGRLRRSWPAITQAMSASDVPRRHRSRAIRRGRLVSQREGHREDVRRHLDRRDRAASDGGSTLTITEDGWVGEPDLPVRVALRDGASCDDGRDAEERGEEVRRRAGAVEASKPLAAGQTSEFD